MYCTRLLQPHLLTVLPLPRSCTLQNICTFALQHDVTQGIEVRRCIELPAKVLTWFELKFKSHSASCRPETLRTMRSKSFESAMDLLASHQDLLEPASSTAAAASLGSHSKSLPPFSGFPEGGCWEVQKANMESVEKWSSWAPKPGSRSRIQK